jgi:hypothetical protein
MSGFVRQSATLAFCAATLVLLGFGAPTRQAIAFKPQPDPPAFGMIGLAQGQTARLNIVSVSPGPCTPSEVSPGPCRVQLAFLDADGRVIVTRSGALAQVTLTLVSGRAASLDLNADDLLIDGMRTEIRGVAQVTSRLVAPGPCRLTLEIVDNITGRTDLIMPAALRTREPVAESR